MSSKQYLSKRVLNIPPSGIRKFFDIANQMEDVISLGVGEVDFPTPWHIRLEGIKAIQDAKTYYTSNRGLLELRKGICDYYARRFNAYYNVDNCLVTVGASEAIDLVMRAIVDVGDEVIILQPGYVAYAPTISLAGGVVKIIELKEEENFKLTKEKLAAAITEKTKMLFINFPSNPTGGIMSKEDYLPLLPLIKEHNLVVLTDEIYAELTYGKKHFSIAAFEEIKDQVIVINGFSKAYAMTGWRLGYILCPEEILDYLVRIHQYGIMCPSTISQYAGVKAINDGDKDVVLHCDIFEQRRNLLVNGLNRIGLKTAMPEGAFYVFANISSTGLNSEEFCEQLLANQRVAVVPGTAFGECGEGFIRISYAYSLPEIKEALQRIEKFIQQLKSNGK